MKKVTIFLETSHKESSEASFVKALCKKINVCEKLIYVGGFKNINVTTNQDQINEICKKDKKALILFDANENIEERQKYLKKYNQKIPIFLFPNNRDKGCFENLLEKIIISKRVSILECFEEFQRCIEKEGYTPPYIKAKMYSYLSVQGGIKNNKWDFSDTYWDWGSKHLDPLKNCIKNL